MSISIQARFTVVTDTAALWTSSNPTLSKGEMGFESDTLRFKFGDGTTVWTGLPYASVPSYGAAQKKNVGIGATVEFFQIVLPEDKAVFLELTAMAGVLGYSRKQEYGLVRENGASAVTMNPGASFTSKKSTVTQSFVFSLAASGTDTVLVSIDGTNLTTAYDTDFRVVIKTMENADTAAITLS